MDASSRTFKQTRRISGVLSYSSSIGLASRLTSFSKGGPRLPRNNIFRRSVWPAGGRRASGKPMLLFVLECALGIVALMLVAALAHWSRWLAPVEALLYLLIVIPTALFYGFWQALIVSLSALVVHTSFSARQPQVHFAADPTSTVTLLAFVLVALIVSRLSARVTSHAREAESWGGQMRDLYEFTRRTLQMNLHMEPGPQLAELDPRNLRAGGGRGLRRRPAPRLSGRHLERRPAGTGAERLLFRDLRRRSRDRASAAGWCGWARCRWAAWWCAAKPVR